MKKNNTSALLLLAITCVIGAMPAYSQTDNPGLTAGNNVRTDIIKVSGITAASQITAANSQSLVSYMDGLGRLVQRVNIHASPLQKDIVLPIAYDHFGRQSTEYLPYTDASANGAFQSTALTDQQTFYQQTGQQHATDNAPYAITTFDQSPLDRVVENGAPGTNWQPGAHTVKPLFRLNVAADNIRIWTATGPSGSYYGVTQLSVNDVADENGHHTMVFINKLGQMVEKKVQGDNSIWLETVYIYDDLGNLDFQVSPEGVKQIYAGNANWGTAFTAAWCCSYSYDAKNRLVSKQAPGAAPVYMVYDSYNRLVLMQDGRIRNAYGATDTWYFTKYDAMNRVIITGLYRYSSPPNPVGSTHQQIIQYYLDGLVYDNVNVFANEQRQAGTTYGYTNHADQVAVADADVLTVNYYDDYDFNNNGTPPNNYNNPNQTGFAAACNADAGGMLTGSKKRILSASGNNGGWINQAYFYDSFGNVIQQQSNNVLNQSALDLNSMAYDVYAGHVTQTLQTKTQGTVIKVLTTQTYDVQGRPLKVSIQINGGTSKVITASEYNELGQLKDIKLGNTTGSSYLQTVDVRYNIRGWLTSINNSALTADGGLTNNDTNDLWGMTILYDQTDASGGIVSTPRFNGQVSAIKWKANDQYSVSTNPIRERGYAYSYDAIGRLLAANYSANGGSSWNAEVGGYNEAVGAYDQNGNIQSLTRNTLPSGGTTPVQIDNLVYSYKNSASGSNQLDAVADNATGTTRTMGFNDGASTTGEYQYDASGNLISDLNKSQVLTYNDLNKVSKIAISGGGWIEYMYDASGTRIRKTVYNASGTVIAQLDYIDGFTYTGGALSYFNMPGGRVDVSGTNFTYEYFINDNLGNTRVSFIDNGSGTAKMVQDNEYYAFGMTMQGMVVRTAQPTQANKHLFNGGSDLQDDLGYENSYSTFYRDYDQVLGRFNAIDPMVDEYGDLTPYNFAFDDPASKNDPGGDDPGDDKKKQDPNDPTGVSGYDTWDTHPYIPLSPEQLWQLVQANAAYFDVFQQESEAWFMRAAAAENKATAAEQNYQAVINEVSDVSSTEADKSIKFGEDSKGAYYWQDYNYTGPTVNGETEIEVTSHKVYVSSDGDDDDQPKYPVGLLQAVAIAYAEAGGNENFQNMRAIASSIKDRLKASHTNLNDPNWALHTSYGKGLSGGSVTSNYNVVSGNGPPGKEYDNIMYVWGFANLKNNVGIQELIKIFQGNGAIDYSNPNGYATTGDEYFWINTDRLTKKGSSYNPATMIITLQTPAGLTFFRTKQ